MDAVYADAVWKRLNAETVWLTCPALSKEGGRRLGADWSILSDPVQRCLRDERNAREWAEAAVREDPDSPAFYTCSRCGGRLYVKFTRPSEKSEPRWRKPRRT